MNLFRPRRFYSLACCLILACALAGCSSLLDDLPEWLGGKDSKVPLPGKRVAVLAEADSIKADETLGSVPVTLPEVKANENWREAGGGPLGMTGNLALSGLTHHDSATIGEGNRWEQPLYPSPIVAGGTVYAMDAKGFITAHSAASIDKILWTNKSLVGKDEPDVLGGGLAFDGGRIYATSGRGKVAAIDAGTGQEIWSVSIGVPLRAAPKVGGGKVYALSVDNQLFALSTENGRQAWSHRGINENAGFLAAISPALSESIVLAPYSSGQIHALDTSSGQDVWSDSLLIARRSSASGGFSGIGGNPIVHDDVAYVPGSSGYIAAIALLTGRRVWEQDIPSLNTPWISGDFLYMLSADNQLVCIYRPDGRIKWVSQLDGFENQAKHKNPLTWRGPIMAGGQLLVANTVGRMLAFSPVDGTTMATVEIPGGLTDTPVVAGSRLYFLTQDAKLHVLY